jgi:sigma-70-like protein
MSRKFQHHRIWDLETLASGAAGNASALRAILEELGHRNSARSRSLTEHIRSALSTPSASPETATSVPEAPQQVKSTSPSLAPPQAGASEDVLHLRILRLFAGRSTVTVEEVAATLDVKPGIVRYALEHYLIGKVSVDGRHRWSLVSDPAAEKLPTLSPTTDVTPQVTAATGPPDGVPDQPAVRELSQLAAWINRVGEWVEAEHPSNPISALERAFSRNPRLPSDLHEMRGDFISGSSASSTRIRDESPVRPLVSWLDSLEQRELTILEFRTFALQDPTKLQQLASGFKISRERVRQLESRLQKRLSQNRHDLSWTRLLWRAHSVAVTAGAACPVNDHAIDDLLRQTLQNVPEHARRITSLALWHLAGPYSLQDGWYLLKAQRLQEALTDLLANNPQIELNPLVSAMEEVGLRGDLVEVWIETTGQVKRHGNSFLRWPRTLGDRLEVMLRTLNHPQTAKDLALAAGQSDARSTRARLSSDPRFWRTSKTKWALSEWGGDQFSSIADSIQALLEENPNEPRLLIDGVSERLVQRLGVADSSVRVTCRAPRFCTSGDYVWMRTNEPITVNTEIADAKGVFFFGDRLVLLLDIDRDILRGSGRAVPPQIAGVLGLTPGQKFVFKIPMGELLLAWPDGSINGPALGSLRSAVEAFSGENGDLVRLDICPTTHSCDISVVKVKDLHHGPTALEAIIGVSQEMNQLEAISIAVGVPSSELHHALVSRGDEFIAEFLPKPDLDEGLGEALGRLGAMLDEN